MLFATELFPLDEYQKIMAYEDDGHPLPLALNAVNALLSASHNFRAALNELAIAARDTIVDDDRHMLDEVARQPQFFLRGHMPQTDMYADEVLWVGIMTTYRRSCRRPAIRWKRHSAHSHLPMDRCSLRRTSKRSIKSGANTARFGAASLSSIEKSALTRTTTGNCVRKTISRRPIPSETSSVSS